MRDTAYEVVRKLGISDVDEVLSIMSELRKIKFRSFEDLCDVVENCEISYQVDDKIYWIGFGKDGKGGIEGINNEDGTVQVHGGPNSEWSFIITCGDYQTEDDTITYTFEFVDDILCYADVEYFNF